MKTQPTKKAIQRGFSLSETLIGTTIVAIVALGAIGMAAQAIVASAPTGSMDQARLSVMSDAVDARAATMYESGAVAAIAAGAPSTGSNGSTTQIQNQTITFTLGALAQAALPLRQGAPAPNSFVYEGSATPSPGPTGVGGPQPSPGPTGCSFNCGGPPVTPTPVGGPVVTPTPSGPSGGGNGGNGGGGGGGGHGPPGQ